MVLGQRLSRPSNDDRDAAQPGIAADEHLGRFASSVLAAEYQDVGQIHGRDGMTRSYRRIGLIGDIHAEDELLELAVTFLESRRVELITATGDVADGTGSVDICCSLLGQRRVVTVCGNHDRWLLTAVARDLPDATPADAVTLESRQFLAQLPEIVEFDTVGGRALLCHGLGPNDMAKVGPDDFGYAIESNDDLQNILKFWRYRWILNGHSHRRMVRDFNGTTLINAGTLMRDQDPCFLELDFENSSGLIFKFAENGRIDPTPDKICL